MDNALVIGGTRFIGRHTVEELLENGYEVTLFNRGNHENSFGENVEVFNGDRNNRDDLEKAYSSVEPDVIIDFVALLPEQVETAVEVFSDVDAYVYVSSAASYSRPDIPMREGETPLHEFGPEHEADGTEDPNSPPTESYGPRKAEGDRMVFEAGKRGVNAMSVRPSFVYGPYDYTSRFDYWIDRVNRFDEVVVPGDGDYIAHQVYVKDVAKSLVAVAEKGEAGNAYNVGGHRLLTLDSRLELIAETLGTDIDIVHTSKQELAEHDIDSTDFPLVMPVPLILDTNKIRSLGVEFTPLEKAYRETVEEHLESEREPTGPARDIEQKLIREVSK